MSRQPACHPGRRYEARGLCGPCYFHARDTGALIDHERNNRRLEDFLDDYRVLRAGGHSRVQIAERLGMTRAAVDTAVSRARRRGMAVAA